ncbi:MAG: M48 family metallopeptidase [Treponema sp.]|nr:M48 family metallopeptidase [Spirochaetia bacterium]MDD7458366.1 M48 family metallopeptidase [Spirochaetales bacterium]MDY5812184.1 M48 family metallopeptidase [Treponema sp.]
MKTKLHFLTAAILASVLSISCATSSMLTDALATAGQAAKDAGYSDAGDVLTATSSASKAMEAITPENEYYIGRAVAATVLTNYKKETSGSQQIYLNKIVNVLAVNSSEAEPFNGYHVMILNSDEVNAFATSGGHIFITRGLLNTAKSEDEVAAALAHEMSHVQLKHSLKAIKTGRWTSAGISVLNTAAKFTDEELASSLDGMVNDQITTLVNNGYSQKQEFQADKQALTLLAQSGYNPTAMLDMLNSLNEVQGSSGSGMFKTHPTPVKRIEKIKAELKEVQAPQDTSSYRKARFAKAK